MPLVDTGELEITIGSETYRAVAGAAALVPPSTAHSVRVLATSTALVVDEGRRRARSRDPQSRS